MFLRLALPFGAAIVSMAALEDRIARFMKSEPSLAMYRDPIDQVLRKTPYQALVVRINAIMDEIEAIVAKRKP